MAYDIQIKRIYAIPEETDGARVLVDRLWPRGKRRDELVLTDWLRDAAPSPALRRSWHKREIDQSQFSEQYRHELSARQDSLLPLMRLARQGRLTLLTASRDPQQSHVLVLQDVLLRALDEEDCLADGRVPSSPTCYAAP